MNAGVQDNNDRPVNGAAFLSGQATHYPKLKQGTIVKMEDRLWLVGMVNECRARLDPLTGVAVAMPQSGRTFTSYGNSINVAATALLDVVPADSLDTAAAQRAERVRAINEATNNRASTSVNGNGSTRNNAQQEGDDMADETNGGGKVAAAPVKATKATKAAKSRAAKLAKRPKNGAIPLGTKKAKGGDKPKREKAVKEERACGCGCGGRTTAWFLPGHDARFKGLMLKVERGEKTPDEVFTKAIVSAYKWVKNGDGLRATTNYRGEPHNGYDAK